MKLVVFLNDKKEILIEDGKHFLQQRKKGKKSIVLKMKRSRKVISREHIMDFIQERYYQLFKQAYMPTKFAY